MMLANDEPQTESEIRAAKRVACIAESMDIIRTLNSNNVIFDVNFHSDTISFHIVKTKSQVLEIIPITGNNGRIYSTGVWTGIAFAW